MTELTVDLEPSGPGLVVRRVDGRTDVGALLADLDVDVRPRRRAGLQTITLAEGAVLAAAGPAVRWQPDALRAVEARARIRDAAPHVLACMRELRDGPLEDARAALSDSRLAHLLDDHQTRNVAAMALPGGWGTCLFDEQGTGKTVTLIATFDLLVERNLADVLIVVAPKSMVAEWKVEFDRFTDGLYRVVVADGTSRQKAAAIRAGGDVLVCSYETLSAAAEEVVRLARRCRLVLAVDESYNAKNPDALRTRSLVEVREHCARAFALCGTPAPNSGVDLVAQFDLVDMGLTFAGPALPREREAATEEVRSRLERGFYLRSLKTDVLAGLPARRHTELGVTLVGDQLRAYQAAERDLIIDLTKASDEEFAGDIASFLARRAMLLRICSDPTPVIPGYAEVPAKLLVLDGLLDNLLGDGRKVVLWSFYRSSLDVLADRYADRGLVRVDGSVPSSQRRAAVRSFQEDPDTTVFLGNPAAAGAGLTLTSGSAAIYESMSNQAAHYMQSLDRIHRRGQTLDVDYYFLLCRDTVEEPEYARLLSKTSVQGDLLGDAAADRPSRTGMLAELTGGGR